MLDGQNNADILQQILSRGSRASDWLPLPKWSVYLAEKEAGNTQNKTKQNRRQQHRGYLPLKYTAAHSHSQSSIYLFSVLLILHKVTGSLESILARGLRAQGRELPEPDASPSQDTITNTFTHYRQFKDSTPRVFGLREQNQRKPPKYREKMQTQPTQDGSWTLNPWGLGWGCYLVSQHSLT